jgi:hypothetical protein
LREEENRPAPPSQQVLASAVAGPTPRTAARRAPSRRSGAGRHPPAGDARPPAGPPARRAHPRRWPPAVARPAHDSPSCHRWVNSWPGCRACNAAAYPHPPSGSPCRPLAVAGAARSSQPVDGSGGIPGNLLNPTGFPSITAAARASSPATRSATHTISIRRVLELHSRHPTVAITGDCSAATRLSGPSAQNYLSGVRSLCAL